MTEKTNCTRRNLWDNDHLLDNHIPYKPELLSTLAKLAKSGYTKTDIAKHMGCSLAWVSRLLKEKYPVTRYPELHEILRTNHSRSIQLSPEDILLRLVTYHMYVVKREKYLKKYPNGYDPKNPEGYMSIRVLGEMANTSGPSLMTYVKQNYPDNDYYEGIEYFLESEDISINTRMKFKDILEWVNYNRITGPYDIKDEFEDDARHITLVRRDESETVAGELTIEGNTITNLEIDTNDYRDVAQDLINYVCSIADKENFNLMVDGKSADSRIKSFLSLAGFRHGDDNILMRTPGAARII